MKKLYVSDLDGTLLNSDAELSEFTKVAINKLQTKGIHFSVATARTAATVLKILEGIELQAPLILMNGVGLMDSKTKKYIKIEQISNESKTNILETIRKNNLSGFIYSIENGELSTFYENINSPYTLSFIQERVQKYNKVFTRVDNFYECLNKNIIYYSISDKKENLIKAYYELSRDNKFHIEFYRDIYTNDFWFLEVSSITASKGNAANFLREEYGYDKIIGFGDNLNDIPLFLACDESYAVFNAKPEVKQIATAVIESNINDGVAKWLIENSK